MCFLFYIFYKLLLSVCFLNEQTVTVYWCFRPVTFINFLSAGFINRNFYTMVKNTSISL